MQFCVFTAGDRNAGQIALHVGCENRDARIGKPFCENLQRDGFACSGRSGDQAVAIRTLEQQGLGDTIGSTNKDTVQHILPNPLQDSAITSISMPVDPGLLLTYQMSPRDYSHK